MRKKTHPKQRSKKASARRQLGPSKKQPQIQTSDDLFGFMKGGFEIVGDIEAPIEDWKYWDPEKNLEK